MLLPKKKSLINTILSDIQELTNIDYLEILITKV